MCCCSCCCKRSNSHTAHTHRSEIKCPRKRHQLLDYYTFLTPPIIQFFHHLNVSHIPACSVIMWMTPSSETAGTLTSVSPQGGNSGGRYAWVLTLSGGGVMRGAGLGGVREGADNLVLSSHAVSSRFKVSPNAQPRSSDKSDPDSGAGLKDRLKWRKERRERTVSI